MARQNQPTAYDELRGKYGLYHAYQVAEKTSSQGGFVQNLPDLAVKVAEERGEEDTIINSLKRSSNSFALSKFLKPGVERFGENYKSFGEDNLEKIIDSTPIESLQANLMYIAPKEDAKGYKDIIELHKEASEMQMNLRAYVSKDVPQELKAESFKNIQQRALKYFMGKYMKNQSYLSALVNYIQVSPDGEQILLAKYAKIASEKTAEFNDKVKDKIVPYTKAVLPKEDAFKFYEMIFRSDVAEESNQ